MFHPGILIFTKVIWRSAEKRKQTRSLPKPGKKTKTTDDDVVDPKFAAAKAKLVTSHQADHHHHPLVAPPDSTKKSGLGLARTVSNLTSRSKFR